ncbi:MMPL family transporter [Kribbella sp. NBC_01245]|uniref:MMPL family transporter n=1 Tax=Kribbella sp. NBC_01245 TaxID=2903578 RepID=UPI002E28E800|nr:MMPL family transporter [Kribbella sp. NBC_01245]
MATYLYRLGRFAFRRRGLVVLVWLGLLGIAITGAATLSGPTGGGFSIPGTESQRAIDLLEQRFPESGADGATARVVFQAPPGEKLTDPENSQIIKATVQQMGSAPLVGEAADPFQSRSVSADGRVAFSQVTYAVPLDEVTPEAQDALKAAADPARAAGLTVEYGGDAMQVQEEQSLTEVLGVAVAAVVLLITFGSLVAAGLPLLSAIIGIGIGISVITAVTGFIDIGEGTPILAMMIGLAVGIDYALFIMSRYRHELSEGLEPEEAAGRAVGTAGSAVLFAGLTVVIALVGLLVAGIPFLAQMGIAAAFTVVIAVLIALTLLPALFGFAGRRVQGRRRTTRPVRTKPTLGRRWAGLVTRNPLPVLLIAVLGLGVVAIPATDLKLGLPDDSTAAPDSSQRKAYELLTAGFGPGFNGPLMLVVDGANADDPKATTAQVATAVRALPGVTVVTPPVFNPAGDTALLTVIPASGPSTTETNDLVKAIRALPVGDVSVTGATAFNIDTSAKLGAALVPYLLLVVGLAFLLLMLVFRSVLVPLKATLGFLLTVGSTFGAVVAVFQWGWFADVFGIEGQTGPVISMLPIFLVGIVFGLAMDYQVFLVTRMREEHVHGATPIEAVVDGFSHGARVVTAAAVIMIGVFGGFILSPETLVREIGFGLAIAVAIDAFVVRMTIVPAVMALLGRSAWWLPAWLDRLLPNVDVEGETLRTPTAPLPERELELTSR